VEALTPSELRVARLAAQGRSNREIADTLVISVRTVEMHLGRTYAKLGIGSRGGLGAALEGDSAPVDGDGAPANAGWIVVAPGSPRERTVPIVGRILIGRECAGLAPPRSLVLDEPRVSRDHLEVVIDGTRGPFLVDRSTNGTWLNDERVERGAPTPMRDGDRIRLGAAVELVFRAPLGPGAPVGPAAETQRAED
jgi:DNA-binding CsgD family transcriptional regulator